MPESVIKRPQSGTEEEEQGSIDLQDSIVLGMGIVLKRAHMLFGKKDISVRLPHGGTMSLVIDPNELPEESLPRLDVIVMEVVQLSHNVGALYVETLQDVLLADGWSWNSHVFRSDPGRSDYLEIPVGEASRIEGMEWLEEYTSGTR